MKARPARTNASIADAGCGQPEGLVEALGCAVGAPPIETPYAASDPLRDRPFEDPVRRVGKFQPLDIGPGACLQHRAQIDVFGDQRVGGASAASLRLRSSARAGTAARSKRVRSV